MCVLPCVIRYFPIRKCGGNDYVDQIFVKSLLSLALDMFHFHFLDHCLVINDMTSASKF